VPRSKRPDTKRTLHKPSRWRCARSGSLIGEESHNVHWGRTCTCAAVAMPKPAAPAVTGSLASVARTWARWCGFGCRVVARWHRTERAVITVRMRPLYSIEPVSRSGRSGCMSNSCRPAAMQTAPTRARCDRADRSLTNPRCTRTGLPHGPPHPGGAQEHPGERKPQGDAHCEDRKRQQVNHCHEP
jgi:hypothetical protein